MKPSLVSNHSLGFEYHVRVNRRARRPQIKVDHQGQVTVVLPRKLDDPQVADLVSRHRDWIEERLANIARRIQQAPERLGHAPREIHLQAVGQYYRVVYEVGTARQRAWQEQAAAGLLQLSCSAQDQRVGGSLGEWLQHKARTVLPEWLARVGRQTGLRYNRVTIRAQKTRWGSCSARANINLNRNLLLLPAALVEYLLLHELCHTRHANHSAAYWVLVGEFMPDYRLRDQQLRYAVQGLPLWALA